MSVLITSVEWAVFSTILWYFWFVRHGKAVVIICQVSKLASAQKTRHRAQQAQQVESICLIIRSHENSYSCQDPLVGRVHALQGAEEHEGGSASRGVVHWTLEQLRVAA